MGRILFIRTCAVTYDEKSVLTAWPRLSALIWPEASSGYTPLAEEALGGKKSIGVLELASGIAEKAKYATLDKEYVTVLSSYAHTLEKQLKTLDEALGNRDIAVAHSLTNDIEDTLDKAEEAVIREIKQ